MRVVIGKYSLSFALLCDPFARRSVPSPVTGESRVSFYLFTASSSLVLCLFCDPMRRCNGLCEPFGQIFQAQGIAIFNCRVRCIEQLEEEIGHAGLDERLAKRLCAEFEIELIAPARVDIDCPHRAQAFRVC